MILDNSEMEEVQKQIEILLNHFNEFRNTSSLARVENINIACEIALLYCDRQKALSKFLIDSIIKSKNIRLTLLPFLKKATADYYLLKNKSIEDHEFDYESYGHFIDFTNTFVASADANFYAIAGIDGELCGKIIFAADHKYIGLDISHLDIFSLALQDYRVVKSVEVIGNEMFFGASGFLRDTTRRHRALLICGYRIDASTIMFLKRDLSANVALFILNNDEATRDLKSTYSSFVDSHGLPLGQLAMANDVANQISNDYRNALAQETTGYVDERMFRRRFRKILTSKISDTTFELAYQGLFSETGKLLGILTLGHDITTFLMQENEISANVYNSVEIAKKASLASQEKSQALSAAYQEINATSALLQAKNADIVAMLSSINQGIFTVLSDFTIHKEYSQYLEKIFETTDIAGANIFDLIFANSDVSSDSLHQLKAALENSYDEPIFQFEVNIELFIKKMKIKTASNLIKFLEIDWIPIVDQDDVVKKVMVTVRDITELRDLQNAAAKGARDIQIIGQILAVSVDSLNSFLMSSSNNVNTIRHELGNNELNESLINLLFREMHTIKGNARTLGFNFISEVAHYCESTYQKLKKGQTTEEISINTLYDDLIEVEQIINQYKDILETKLKFRMTNDSKPELQIIEFMQKAINDIDTEDKSSLSKLVEYFKSLLNTINYKSIHDIMQLAASGLESIARELDKPTPYIQIEDNGILLTKSAAIIFQDILIHALRNSIDHGIEGEQQRIKIGKNAIGTISIMATMQKDSSVLIKYSDDGRGLNLKALRMKGYKSGLLKAPENGSDEEIAALIFVSGLTTSKEINRISGRGVGMDAVKFMISQKLNGNVSIELTSKANNDGFRNFNLVFHLPSHIASIRIPWDNVNFAS